MEIKDQVLAICETLYDKKAQDIVAIHVADKTVIADWFVIASGRAVTQVKALCDELEEKTPGFGLTRLRIDGYSQGRWIVLDYASILVHIFLPDERQYYNMERLWMDAPEDAIQYSELKERELEQ